MYTFKMYLKFQKKIKEKVYVYLGEEKKKKQ